MKKRLINTLAKAYRDYCRQHDGKYNWVDSPIQQHLDNGTISKLELIQAVADLCTTDHELNTFVAHPILEDLIYNPTEFVVADLSTIIKRSPNIARALQMLYFPANTTARGLIEEILSVNGMQYGLLASQIYPHTPTPPHSNAKGAWAWHWFQDHPMELKIVCLFIHSSKTDDQLKYFARGPLTVLIQSGGDSILSELDALAGNSKNVRRALCGVIVDPETPAFTTMDWLCSRYKLAYGSL